MFLCTYILLKASSCVTFSVFFATRASIICINSGTCDTIRVALAIRFFDISINHYTPIINGFQLPDPFNLGKIIKNATMCPYIKNFSLPWFHNQDSMVGI